MRKAIFKLTEHRKAMHQNTSYATMAGNICLDKAVDFEGNPAPVTFSVRKVVNGHHPWQQGNGNMTFSMGHKTLAQAIEELHSKFLMEMEERNYELRHDGMAAPWAYGPNDKKAVWRGESGWYDLNNPSDGTDYPLQHYPETAEAWVRDGLKSYSYDNYSVCIVTSNGDLVW